MKTDRSRQTPLALPGAIQRPARQRPKAASQSLRKPVLIDYQSWMALTAGVARAAAAAAADRKC